MASRSVPKYCCYLQSVNTGAHGSGFIVELKDLQTANLLALNWEKRGKTGELQTDYALITSHDTIPGSSLSELNRWTVWCQSIKNGNEQILSDLVCGVISCCGAESLLAGHTAETTVTVFRPHPGKASCDIQLNITILFLNSTFAVLSTVSPPMILVKEYLDQNAYTQLHQRIITTGRNSCVSYCDGVRSVKTASLSVVEQQRTSEHGQELAREMIEFEKFQKLESNATMKICHGSPVYLNPDTDTDKVIGVHVGETVTSQQLVVTFHGILRLLQGGLIPVLSVLHCLDLPKAWVSRWGYLVTPHIDQMERMESGYLCEVLHFLLKKRHGTPLVKLPVDLVDVDNEASLDLLCVLFKHFKSADMNGAVTKLNLRKEINTYITRLCKNVINLLELGAKMVTDRRSLVEKCLIFYNLLLNIKFAGITEQILGTSENLRLLEKVSHRYKHSDVVRQNATAISLRRSSVETLENQRHYEAYQEALKKEIKIKLKYLKMLFFGPPRTGKTSMRRRLVGEIQNLTNKPVQTSTGTAESYDAIVKLVEETLQGGTNTTEGYDVIVKLVAEDKTTYSTALIAKSSWLAVTALFGKEKNTHETDLDEELQLLYQFINRDAPLVERKSLVSDPVEKRMQSEATKEEILPVQAKPMVETPTDPSAIQDEASETGKVNPDTRIQQVVLPSGQPKYGLNAKEIEEIEKVYEAFTKVMCAPRQDQLKVLLDGTILMNMVDTGGHPAFLEMLPALTMGPALYLIFFRLDQELKNTYQIKYVSNSNKEVQLGESSYTVEEVIFQALSTITWFSCTEAKENMPSPSHAAVLIGTHKDLLGSDPEAKIKAKDDALQEEILLANLFKARKKFLRQFSEDQLMFAVDNMNGDKEELTKVRKRLEQIMKTCFRNFSIPASWLMFSIFLRRMSKMGNRTLSLSQCREIGDRLKVRDTDAALWFLHRYIGTLMHFPDVEEIKEIVICDPQVVFDSVTELILNSFTFNTVDKIASESFKRTGQFSFEDIQKTEEKLKCDILPPLKLLKLLQHLNIIAPIKSEGPQSDAYFMPAVLEHATEEELDMEQSPTDPVPLMICFKCGFVPVGVFCAMIASLVAQEHTLGWSLQEPRNGHQLCKNKTTFRINGAFNITLISKPKWYEIHIVRISPTDRAMEEICQHVLETVCEVLDDVIFKLKYKRLISSDSDQTLYELGFKCPKHPDDDHLVINKPKGGVKSWPSQSVISLWLKCLASEGQRQSTMICLKEQIFIDLRDTHLPKPFAQQSLVWFGEATEISSASPDLSHAKGTSHGIQSHAKELNVKNVVNVLHEAKFADGDWPKLGLQLIDHTALTTIKSDYGESSLCMIETISRWLKTDSEASWEKLAEAVLKVGRYGEATANIVREKGGIVHTAAETIQSPQEEILPLTSNVDIHVSIQGADNVGEMTLKVVPGKPLNYHWKGHGLRLHIPADALDPSTPPLIMRIQASLSGQFKLPDDMDLVSGVYWISFPARVLKNQVTLELQHCAYLEQSEQTYLSFVTSKCNQPLPYQFKPLPGGVFTTSSDYGTVQLNHFSAVAVAKKKGRRTQSHNRKQEGDTDDKSAVQRVGEKYLVLTYFTQARPTRTTWKMYFTIIPHLELRLKRVEKYYSKEEAESSVRKQVFFQMDKVTLDIPEAGFKLLNGWSIVPMTHPASLMQTEVDSYVDSIPPSCQLELHFQKTEQPYERLSHQIKVSGFQGISTITITRDVDPELRAAANTLGKRKYELDDPEIQKETEILSIENLNDITSYLNQLDKTAIIHLGIILGLNYNRLKLVMDTPTFLDEMLAGWLQQVDQVLQTGSPTWRRLVKALKDPRVGQNGLASKIEQDKKIN